MSRDRHARSARARATSTVRALPDWESLAALHAGEACDSTLWRPDTAEGVAPRATVPREAHAQDRCAAPRCASWIPASQHVRPDPVGSMTQSGRGAPSPHLPRPPARGLWRHPHQLLGRTSQPAKFAARPNPLRRPVCLGKPARITQFHIPRIRVLARYRVPPHPIQLYCCPPHGRHRGGRNY